MELENKHLKSYFGTELKGIIADDGIVRELYSLFEYTLQVTPSKHGFTYCLYEHFKPLLLPLSALTEPMEDGSIPIMELAKIASIVDWEYNEFYIEYEYIVAQCGEFHRFIFDGKSFWFQNGHGNAEIAKHQLQLFEYLFVNHFDVFGLIDAGLAIDKRTIK